MARVYDTCLVFMFIRNVCVDENEERRNLRRMGVRGWARMEDGGWRMCRYQWLNGEGQVCEQ
jgi:hypothetical protein